jgi:hypothetical protein
MPYEYYYAKRANIELLDEQIWALPFAAGRYYSGSAWLDPSITPEAGKSLRLTWGRELTETQEVTVNDVVVAHDASQKTQDQIDREAAAAADAAELAEIQALTPGALAGTLTLAEVNRLAGLVADRLYGGG